MRLDIFQMVGEGPEAVHESNVTRGMVPEDCGRGAQMTCPMPDCGFSTVGSLSNSKERVAAELMCRGAFVV